MPITRVIKERERGGLLALLPSYFQHFSSHGVVNVQFIPFEGIVIVFSEEGLSYFCEVLLLVRQGVGSISIGTHTIFNTLIRALVNSVLVRIFDWLVVVSQVLIVPGVSKLVQENCWLAPSPPQVVLGVEHN